MIDEDDLRRRLESLDADLHPADLPGPAAARQRAQRRVRRRNATVGGLAVLVVAGAIALPTGLPTGDQPPPAGPATTTTPSPTHSPEPPLTAEMLLAPEDLEPQGTEPIGWGIAWDTQSPTDPPFEPFACAPEPQADATQMLQRSLAVMADREPWPGRADQVVERFDTTTAAQARFDEIRSAVYSCARDLEAGPAPPEQWTPEGIGERTWLARYWTPADAPQDYGELVEFSLVRTGTTVTSITRGFHTMDANLAMEPDLAIAAIERLCGAANHVCLGRQEAEGGEPTGVRGEQAGEAS